MGAKKPSVEKVDVFTPEQSATLRKLNEATGGRIEEMITGLGYDLEGNPLYQQGAGAISGQLTPFDPQETADVFKQTIGDPARESFQEEFIPALQERYVGRGGGRGSAAEMLATHGRTKLEGVLAGRKSATILSAKQQKEQIRQNAITQALQFGGAPGQQQLSEIDRFLQALNIGFTTSQKVGTQAGSAGLLPSMIQAGGAIGAAKFSSRKVKENIRDFKKGLELVKDMVVKKYDYKNIGLIQDRKNHLGLIAEDLPKEIQKKYNGILCVDIYGLLAITINAIKELSHKVEMLEAK